MERFEGYVFTALCSLNFLIACLVFSKITHEQRKPYMDEIFHVPQAKKYCEGKFNEWDPMITTPPGLYLVSVGLIKPVMWLLGWTGDVVCSTGMLRFVNVLFSCGNVYLLYLLVTKLHCKDKARTSARRILLALTLSTFPVLYFFTFLYYTDAGSTFFALFAYHMSLYGSHKAAALLCTCAILFRQTNVVWLAFCAGVVVARKMDDVWKVECSKKKEEKPQHMEVPLSIRGVMTVASFLVKFVTTPAHVRVVLLEIWPYVGVVSGFIGFVVVNGGIVVGDRSSHEVSLNVPQLFYFVSFTLVFSFPCTLSYGRVVAFLRSVKKRPLLYLLTTAVGLLVVLKLTYVHQYLLADNRHYPFYLWRKVFQKHWLVRYLLVPCYVFAGWNFLETLKMRPLLWLLSFLVCLLASTVPQKLLEFRYFILPYLMYRLHAPLPSVPRLLLELGLYTIINAVTVYIFLEKTFHWPQSVELQRFMW